MYIHIYMYIFSCTVSAFGVHACLVPVYLKGGGAWVKIKKKWKYKLEFAKTFRTAHKLTFEGTCSAAPLPTSVTSSDSMNWTAWWEAISSQQRTYKNCNSHRNFFTIYETHVFRLVLCLPSIFYVHVYGTKWLHKLQLHEKSWNHKEEI